jgi:hypothetical protein
MKKSGALLVISILLVTLISCNLPFLAGKSVSNDVDIQSFIEKVDSMGELDRVDKNGDGLPEQLVYSLPAQLVAIDIYLEQQYGAEIVQDRSGYYPVYGATLRNSSDNDQYVEVVLDFPKEFAADISELTFNIDPLEILNPDPSAKFGFSIPARSKIPNAVQAQAMAHILSPGTDPVNDFMWMTLTSAADACDTPFVSDAKENEEYQAACYLRVVDNYEGFINDEELGLICGRLPGEWPGVCSALVFSDPEFCKRVTNKETNSVCTGMLIKQLCRTVSVETRGLCYAEGALELNSIGGCSLVPDGDIRNDCLARVKKDSDYCKEINDPELKAQCVAMVGGKKDDLTNVLAQLASGEDYGRFTTGEAAELCRSFSTVTATYQFIKSSGTGDVLSCYYGDDKDKEREGETWKILLWIKEYPGAAEALQEWQEVNSPDSPGLNLTLNRSLLVRSSHTDTQFFYLEKTSFTSAGQEVNWYTIHAGSLQGKFRIEYVENSVPTDGEYRWNAALQRAKEIIE